VVGKRAVIPRGVRIGRNVKIAEGVRASDYRGHVVRSGNTVEHHRDLGDVGRGARPEADLKPAARPTR
jgi:acetyltransferase-like isoleucine patch superfamily enzyme